MLSHFKYSIGLAVIGLIMAFMYGSWTALFAATTLAILEISFSFDNAVLNARILQHWNHFWRTMFLTVGILVAVFGMRLLFPLVIVSQTADMSIVEAWNMAFDDPKKYSATLTSHHAEIAAYGGTFLMLVFLNFLFDPAKDLHWHSWIESKMAELGRINAVSVLVTMAALIGCVNLVPEHEASAVLTAGVFGIMTFLGVDFISNLMENEEETDPAVMKVVSQGSIGGFLYLEMLDASFSFDGVIGAFAITNDIVIIMIGLCIGAFFVRSMTTYLVDKGTLQSYKYLEHGAHYAIGILAAIMLIGVKYEVPEVVTGLSGLAFIAWSVIASIRSKDEEVVA